MGLVIYNTLTGKKEEFIPLKDKEVKMYVCGVTLYDELHLGHARAAVIFDLMRRYLEYRGYRVKYVTNFTDVDDKMIDRAKVLGISILDLADKFIKEYMKHMNLLGIKRAHEYPRATESIKEIVDLIKRLEEKGLAYHRNGDIFFRVKKFPQYGKLSHQGVEDLEAGARLEIDERKIDPLDFALWKKEKEGEPSWDSPWGKGRPGWHIECSAMAMKFLGEEIDIHGGGKDLIFPHHENEIAQSEGATGKRFVMYWIHNGLLTLKDQKMAKSTGNVLSLSQALKKFDSETVRYYLLCAHYRSPLDYREEALREAASSLERVQNFLQRAKEIQEQNKQTILSRDEEERTTDLAKYADGVKQNFILAMDDDFNTPLVFSRIFGAVKKANLLMGKADPLNKNARDALLETAKEIKRIGEVLALFGERKKKGVGKDASQLIEILVAVRDKLREKKHWKLADDIRKKLDSLGIELEDTRARTVWRLKG
ncbi:Cysteine--tRNA ligase [subsurface metagenome]